MYFLIILGVVASVLKFMRFEPVVDWSLHPLRMVFYFYCCGRLGKYSQKSKKNKQSSV